MRDRLIELLGCEGSVITKNDFETVADHLLTNGVIVLPCKVGHNKRRSRTSTKGERKMNIKYAEHLQFQPKIKDLPDMCKETELTKSIQTEIDKVKVMVIDTQNKAIYNAVIEFAMNRGLTDLFLLDEEFVKTALINEHNRRINDCIDTSET